MVLPAVENRELCMLQETRRNSCDEMSTVRKAIADTRELQRYVDAQAGGPGKGFFEIVTSPNEARRVINEGKMAVVLEIEVSELFGCHGWDAPTCDRAQVDRGLEEAYRLGVRSSLLLNKFDNPLAGVRFDSGTAGTIVHVGQRDSAGSWWSAETCKGKLHDNTIETYEPGSSAFLEKNVFAKLGVASGTFPTYPPAPHCNTRGLTELGRHLEREMMKRGMIINPDHMSQRAVDDTLTLAEANHYSGLISPHGWMDPGNWPRLWKLGGVAWPGHSGAKDYVKDWEKYRPKRTPYLLGAGFGADMGGISNQPGPEAGVRYPFKSYDGRVTFDRQKTGERTFDYTKDGVAHYGLYADWFENLRRVGGAKFARDMENGAEAYLEMWERASGIRAPNCRSRRHHLRARKLGVLRLGDRWETVLRRAGQPQQRSRAWSWCVRGRRRARAADVAELSPGGRVELVGSTALGRDAGRIAVGGRAAGVRRLARSVGQGVFVGRVRGSAFVYSVRRGRVRAVGVATRALVRRPARLRAAMRRLLRARASQAGRAYVPNAKAEAAGLTGAALAGSTNPRLNAQLAALCYLRH
jgi:hypothetical protein